MANGTQQQPQQQYTSAQIKSILQFAKGDPNAPVSQDEIDLYTKYPGLFQSTGYGGSPSGAGQYGTGANAQNTSIVGAKSLGSMLGLIQAAAPQPAPAAPAAQPQMPQMPAAQPMPTVNITPLQAQPQQQITQPTMNVPQASAQGATPLFSMGQMPGLGMQQQFQSQLPQAQNPLQQWPNQQQQPVQRFQSGGQVQSGSGNQIPLPSGTSINPQTGETEIVDPAFSSQLGLGNLTQDQLRSLGYNPTNLATGTAQGAAQVGALYQPSLLGAAALQMPAVINLPPSSQMNNPKGGVNTQPGGAIVGQNVPQTPVGPWLTNPSVFAKAATPTLSGPGAGWTGQGTMPLTATPQANAAQMPQMPITPANAANLGGVAGKPNTDTVPAMLTPHEFVLNPGATAAMGPQNLAQINAQYENGPRPMAPSAPGPGPAAAGATTALATQGTPQVSGAFAQGFQHGFMGLPKQPMPAAQPVKAQTGGYVLPPQQQEQAPVRMQAGGYVFPQQQQEPIRMQTGGYIPGQDPTLSMSSGYPAPYTGNVSTDPSISRAISSVLGLPTNPWHPNNPPQQTAQQPPQQPAQRPPASQGQPQLGDWARATTPAAQPAAAQPTAFNPLSGYGMPGGQAQPNWTPNQVRDYASGGTGSGPGSGMPTANALGSIGSGLQQAAQAIASSVKPWQMQANAIPPAPGPSQYQTTNLQQSRVV